MLSKANSTGRPGSGQPCPGGMLHACLAQLTPKWVFLKHLPEQWGRPVWAQRAREVTAELTAHNCLRCPACAMRCGSQCTHLASTPAGILLPPLTSANSCSSPVQGTICPIQMQSHPHSPAPHQSFCLHHNSSTAEFHLARKDAPNFLPKSEFFDPDLQGVYTNPSKATRLLPALRNSACSLLQHTH